MFTSLFMKKVVDFLAFPLETRNICVFMAPIFSCIQCVSTYLLTKEATNRPDAGLLAALFMAVNVAIITRGVAGSYDNEAVAIWALIHTFYLWIKSVNTGSIGWSVACALQYFYMVASWGGYTFIVNLIPVFVLGTIFVNRFDMKIYIAYSIFYTLGTLLSLLIVFANYQVMRSSEHLASHFTFVAMNAYAAVNFIKNSLEARQLAAVVRLAYAGLLFISLMIPIALTTSGATKFSGRVMTLIDPSYAKDHAPLIASVAEHAPPVWTRYFAEINALIYFMPLGFYYTLVHKVTHGKLFLGMWGVFAAYFSSVMSRLMLLLAPAACILAGIAVSSIIRKTTKTLRLLAIGKRPQPDETQPPQKSTGEDKKKESVPTIGPGDQKPEGNENE